MFSYRHAFHAGNHADVLKHSILLHILKYFNQKDKPYCVIDTHAGAGVYDLGDEWAQKNREFDSGMNRLLQTGNLPSLLADYLQMIESLNEAGSDASIYPGSPWICLSHLGADDRLHLFEMHPSEYEALRHNLSIQDRSTKKIVKCYSDDGFTATKRILPPPSRRGLIVMDPSYEDKKDYAKVLKAIDAGLQRFRTGCYMIWYPLAQRPEMRPMLDGLQRSAGNDISWLDVQLAVTEAPVDGLGLYGSGVFVLNPPYTLPAALQESKAALDELLVQDSQGGGFKLASRII